jgi:hypothetical protein
MLKFYNQSWLAFATNRLGGHQAKVGDAGQNRAFNLMNN